jgi:SAM-dependent MidA family methyltransferase
MAVPTLERPPPMSVAELPDPGEAALAHSRAVTAHLRAIIAAEGGQIPFSRYMHEVLYAPGLGYYSAGTSKFGAAGDFVTAPEISPLFGRCVARQLAQVLGAVGEAAVILELGAGSGALAAEVLAALDERSVLPAAYLILEVSADLRQRQQALIAREIPALAERVRWLDALPETPMQGAVFANEVLDALPVERFRMASGRAQRLGVAADENGFGWVAGDDDALASRVAELGSVPDDGYTSELPDYRPLLASLSDVLARGALLFVDYGLDRGAYYAPERHDGTLACHYRHRVHPDPFLWPGLNDVTAWVEFTQLAEAGDAAGFRFAGYTSQAQFLIDAGLEAEVARLAAAGDGGTVARADLARQVRWLTMPDEMGERFKAMAFLRDLDSELLGFDGPDLAHRL